MAINVRIRLSPALPIAACAAAHNSSDLVFEGGKFGVAVETNIIGAPNTFITHGVVVLPVPAALAVGTKVYAVGTTFAAGAVVQAVGDTYRTTAVATVLTATAAGNTLIGTLREASTAYGATTAAAVELAPQ